MLENFSCNKSIKCNAQFPYKQEIKLRGYFLHRREYKFSFTCTENEKVNRLSLVFNKLT